MVNLRGGVHDGAEEELHDTDEEEHTLANSPPNDLKGPIRAKTPSKRRKSTLHNLAMGAFVPKNLHYKEKKSLGRISVDYMPVMVVTPGVPRPSISHSIPVRGLSPLTSIHGSAVAVHPAPFSTSSPGRSPPSAPRVRKAQSLRASSDSPEFITRVPSPRQVHSRAPSILVHAPIAADSVVPKHTEQSADIVELHHAGTKEEAGKLRKEVGELRKKLKEAEKEKTHLGKKLGKVTKRLLVERTKFRTAGMSLAPAEVSTESAPMRSVWIASVRVALCSICNCFIQLEQVEELKAVTRDLLVWNQALVARYAAGCTYRSDVTPKPKSASDLRFALAVDPCDFGVSLLCRSQELEKRVIALKASGMFTSVPELLALSDLRPSASGTPLGATVEELARKLLDEMGGNAKGPTRDKEPEDEAAADSLRAQIAARFPKGGTPEQVWYDPATARLVL